MNDLTLDQWQRLDTLVDEALARPRDERTAFLRARCGDDPPLYQEALALIDRMDDAAALFGESAATFAAPLLDGPLDDTLDIAPEAVPDALGAGALVGAYRIEEEIGRGGMGTVYRAARADGTFEKAVALKLVKRGMDTDDVLRRFSRERRILAGLDHPAVARLLDAGAAPDGRPFLAMEYVDGVPITRYCDRKRAGIAARLQLFERVCQAVSYAHRRLIVHRDLKPSNILVAEGESGPEVKLLDFGIARLLDTDTGDETLTRPGARRPLTPAYAAPEQLRGEAATTVADVYALGVVLHELLVGMRPTRGERAVRHPSASVTEQVAAARGTTPERLRRELRGDLDVVVQTALAEEPEARYASVDALLDDLRRHRTGLPLHARAPTARYRLRKFVQRHRTGVMVTAAFIAFVAFAAVAFVLQERQTVRERDRAEGVRDFLIDVFALSDPDAAREALPALSVLDDAIARVDSLGGQPELQAELYVLLGQIYQKHDRYDRADSLFDAALTRRLALYGPEDASIAEVRNARASIDLERGNYAEAETGYHEALRVYTLNGEDGRVAAVSSNLGNLYRIQGRLAEADSFLSRSLVLQRALGNHLDQRDDFATAVDRVASLRRSRGDLAAAESLGREALALRIDALGPDHRHVYLSKNNLGLTLFNRGKLDEAEAMYREVYDFNLARLGREHLDTATALMHLGDVALERGDYEAAADYYRETSALNAALLGPGHPWDAIAQRRMAETLLALGQPDAAERHARAALAIAQEERDGDHVDVGRGYATLGAVFLAQNHLDEAARSFREALAIQEASQGVDHYALAPVLRGLGEVLLAEGRHAEAATVLQRAVRLQERALVEDAVPLALSRFYLGECHAALGHSEDARPLLTAAHASLARARGTDDPVVQSAQRALGRLPRG